MYGLIAEISSGSTSQPTRRRSGSHGSSLRLFLGTVPRLHDPGPRSDLWRRRYTPIASHGHSGQTDCTGLTLAEWLCRTADRIDPARVFGPHHCLGRGTSAPDSSFLCRLLQFRQNASVVAQGCADFSFDSTDRNHPFTPDPRRASPSLCPGLSFRYTQASGCAPHGTRRKRCSGHCRMTRCWWSRVAKPRRTLRLRFNLAACLSATYRWSRARMREPYLLAPGPL